MQRPGWRANIGEGTGERQSLWRSSHNGAWQQRSPARRGHELDAETPQVEDDGAEDVHVCLTPVAAAGAHLPELERAAEELVQPARRTRSRGGRAAPVFLTGAASASPTIMPLADARAARESTGHGQNTDNRSGSTVAPAVQVAISS